MAALIRSLAGKRSRSPRQSRQARGGQAAAYLDADTINAIDAVERPDGERRIVPLTTRQIANRIKQACAAAGIEGVSTHGARVGMAQDLAEGGAELPELMQAGSWKSDRMVAHYVRQQAAPRNAVAKFHNARRRNLR